ncbi:MAG: hypothetical protein OXH85_06540 [Truepera sp.]|nr:hypothetical protein [Truepera sp.]
MRRTMSLLLVAAVLGGLTEAQSLATLAPANTLLTLQFKPQRGFLDTLPADLAALDWEGAVDTLSKLSTLLAGDLFDESGESLGDIGMGGEEIAEACPPLASSLDEPGLEGLISDALLTVSISTFNPLPVVTAFARVAPAFIDGAAAMNSALVECFSGLELKQDSVTIHVLGNGSDQPISVAWVASDIYVASTNPDMVRMAIRLAAGSAEASLADTRLWQEASRMSREGLGFSLALAPLAELIEAFGPSLGSEEALLGRAVAALRTLGGIAGTISADPEGLLFELIVAVDPEGGDTDLAELTLCRSCTLSVPSLAPRNSLAVNSQVLPLRGIFAYLQSWLDDIELLVGEELDLKLLLEGVGLDLDRALLGWIGNEYHLVQLEAYSPDLGSLLYAPATVTLIPVSSPEKAHDGLVHLAEVASNLATQLLNNLDLGDDIADSLVVRSGEYRGVEFTRIQASLNIDLAFTLLGSHLVIAHPSYALEAVVDTFMGEPSILENAAYLEARNATPPGATAIGYADSAALLSGFVELAELVSQPLAFGIQVGVTTAMQERRDSFDHDWLGPVDLTGIEPIPLTVPNTLSAPATEEGRYDFEASRFYRLDDLIPGETVVVEMSSDEIDTYLYLIDATASLYIGADDDSPDTSRSKITFTVQRGVSYWIEATSFSGLDTGTFELSATMVPGGLDALTSPGEVPRPPSYSDLLDLTELLPRTLTVLRDHLGHYQSYTVTDGDTIYARSLVRLRW